MTANERCGDTGIHGAVRSEERPIFVRCRYGNFTPRTILSNVVTVQSAKQLGMNEITIYEPHADSHKFRVTQQSIATAKEYYRYHRRGSSED